MKFLHADRPAAAEAADLLAVGVASSAEDGALNDILGDFAADLRTAAGDNFSGKAGQCAVFPSFGRVAATRVALVGLGDGTPTDLRRAAGAAFDAARKKGDATVAVSFGDLDGAEWDAVVEGAHEGAWRFDRHKAEASRTSPPATVTVLGKVANTGDLGEIIAQARAFARDLTSETADELYPATLAQAAQGLAGGRLTVEVWEQPQIEEAGMGGILAVGKGSNRGPRFIHMKYVPDGKPRKRIGLVGKGVTYDAGGLNLKPGSGLQTMRCDMGGSAAVIGAMKAIAALQPDVEVHGIVGAVENMLGGSAYKLGDVLHISNGKTVEVHNTDAEGRLVLADCLSYASKLELDAVVDLATLTGACIVALGEEFNALFSDDDALIEDFKSAAAASGEHVWRLPLWAPYRDKLKSEWADMKNVGGRAAGSITAALFLKEFVDNTRWIHVDIAGPAFTDKQSGHMAPGGMGAMVATLTRWVLS